MQKAVKSRRKPQTDESRSTRKTSPGYRALAKRFGDNVRRLRKAQSMTLDQFAERTSLDIAHITRTERGLLNITLWTVFRLADGLGTRVEALFADPPSEADGVRTVEAVGSTQDSGATTVTSGKPRRR